MADFFGGWFFSSEGECAAWLKDAFVDFGERVKALFSRCRFKLRRSDQLFLQSRASQFAIFDQHIGVSLDNLLEFVVTIKKTDHEIVDEQQGSGADQATGDAVIVTDDGILHRIRKGQQNDEVERIKLDQLAFSGESEAHDQERVHNDRPENLLDQGQSQDKHIFPDFMRWHISSHQQRDTLEKLAHED